MSFDLAIRPAVTALAISLALAACAGNTEPRTDGTGAAGSPAGSAAGTPSSSAPTAKPTADAPPAPSTSATTAPTTPVPVTPPPAGWGPAACPAPANVGFAVGDSIGDLGIKDCDTGAAASIDELCGASATWIFAAHTHCPTCQATAGFSDDVAKAVESKNAAVIQLVYDDNGTSCAEWRAAYKLAGISNVRVYADPGGKAFGKLRTENYTAASAFLDKNRVVTFKAHGLGKAQVMSQIDAALAK
jgi:hypothetical protein